MIKSIRLVNWRSHADSRLAFQKGTNLLVGIMGAGKSSILEAISFALFGTFQGMERRKLKIDNLVRLNEQTAKVILEFEWENTIYRIERAIERSKRGVSTSAEIYKDGKLVEHGQSAVTNYIQHLISIDYDLFTRAIYSEQNNIDYFLNLDPRRRREEIDRLLGLDRFEAARANIVTVINQIRSKRQLLESQAGNADIAADQEKEKGYAKDISESQTKLGELHGEWEGKNNALGTNSKLFDSMKKDKDNFESADRELLRLATQLESLKKELEGKETRAEEGKELEKKIADATSSRNKCMEELKSAEQKQNSISKEIGALESRIKAIAQAEKTAQAVKKDLEAQLGGETQESLAKMLKDGEARLLALSSEKSSLEREIREINELIPKLQEGSTKCPLCLSELASHSVSHIKAEKAKILEQKNSRSRELATALAALKTETASLAGRVKTAAALSEKLTVLKIESAEVLEGEKERREKEMAEAAEHKKNLQAQADRLSADLDSARTALRDLKNLIAKQAEMERVAKAAADTKAKMSGIKFDGKEFEGLRSRMEADRIEIERLNATKKSIESNLRSSTDLLKLVQERIARAKAVKDETARLAKLDEELSIYKNALLETQTALRLNLIDAINSAMNEVWPIFYPYKNYHALRLGVSEKDYVFEVSEGNKSEESEWKGLETVASGGERACAALALRVAFAMVLTPNLSWLILDEPTHNLDSEAVELLSSALQHKVPEVVKQTFVITHDEAFMGSEFASSYRLDRDKGQNGETKVEAM